VGNAYPTGLSDRNERDQHDKLVPVERATLTPWDRGRRLARPVLIAAVLGALGVVQARAQVLQVKHGFRPLEHEPGRVPFSWDMFAVRITRCTVDFEPPLKSRDGSRTVRSFAALSPVIEWNPVFNEAQHYAGYAERLCTQYTARNQDVSVRLVCFDHNAMRHFYDMKCR